MIFAAPWVLLALPALPLLWWLLRVTPPAPRSESFPAIRLLMGLHAREETPARTPWWLLLLRMVAATLVILALARPVLDAGSTLAGSGPVLLVVDNGWASAGDWPRRMQAANTLLDRAERAGREVALLATAPDGSAAAPQATVPLPVADLRARVAALHPEAWPPDRAAAAKALLAWHQPDAAVVYLGDGLTHGSDFTQFAAALGEAGKVTELRSEAAPARLLLPPDNEADRLVARVAQAPQPPCQQVRGACAKRRWPHPGPRYAGSAGWREPSQRRNRAAARTAQSAEPAGAGRSADGCLRGAARRTLAPAAGRDSGRRSCDRRHPIRWAALLPASRTGAVHRGTRGRSRNPAATRAVRY